MIGVVAIFTDANCSQLLMKVLMNRYAKRTSVTNYGTLTARLLDIEALEALPHALQLERVTDRVQRTHHYATTGWNKCILSKCFLAYIKSSFPRRWLDYATLYPLQNVFAPSEALY